MEVFEGRIRQIGTSAGVIIPKEVMEEEKMKIGQNIKLAVLNKDPALVDKYFGMLGRGKKSRFVRDHKDRVF